MTGRAIAALDSGSVSAPRRQPARMTLVQGACTVVALAVLAGIVDWSKFVVSLATAAPGSLAIAAALLVANLLIVGARFHRLLRGLGIDVGIGAAQSVNLRSVLAGAAFFQIFGQFLSRSAFLHARGLTPSASFVLTLCERTIAAAVAFVFALAGLYVVFGGLTVNWAQGGAFAFKLFASVLIAVPAALWVSLGRRRAVPAAGLGSRRVFPALTVATLLTVLAQATMVGAWATLASGYLPERVTVEQVVAGSFVIMFVSSLPISLAGWGLRELSAVYVLGQLGFPQAHAVVVAVIIGVLALVLPLGLVLIERAIGLLRAQAGARAAADAPATEAATAPTGDYERAVGLLLPVLCAALVLFQFRAQTAGGGAITLNLSDPVAITGGIFFVLHFARTRRLPRFRDPMVLPMLVLVSIVLAAGFLVGYARHDLIPWALNNRLLGWWVLLGYFATGALAVVHLGEAGRDAMLRALVASAAVVAVVELVCVGFYGAGWPMFHWGLIEAGIEGFAANRNAFAIQLLVAISAAFAMPLGVRADRARSVTALAIGAMMATVWITYSKSGVILLTTIVATCVVGRLVTLRRAMEALLAAALIVIVVDWMSSIDLLVADPLYFVRSMVNWMAELAGIEPVFVLPERPTGGFAASTMESFTAGYGTSMAERWLSYERGLVLWLQHPLLGAGLGAFIHTHVLEHDFALLIHNTWLWALAELGPIGLAVFAGLFLSFLRFGLGYFRSHGGERGAALMLLLLIVFVPITQVHDMLYQRILWLVWGVLLVATPVVASPARGDAGERGAGAGDPGDGESATKAPRPVKIR